MDNEIKISSYKGVYTVKYKDNIDTAFQDILNKEVPVHYLVDSNIKKLYSAELTDILKTKRVIIINAEEKNKSIENSIIIVQKLIANNIRRNHVLCAIGGGIVQDITCFISSILFRGIKWEYIPTTLLAQADSCIGSKSSINMGDAKNILGTFCPPSNISISINFLKTLDDREILSGIGEIFKVHAIAGRDAFNSLAEDYDGLFSNPNLLKKYSLNALLIKKKYIEIDEFDQNNRLIFNYGHSFGHGIEAATNFKIPHGIAVTIGMDMANDLSESMGLLPSAENQRMHVAFRKVYMKYSNISISTKNLIKAMQKDKKNTSEKMVLILATGIKAKIEKVPVSCDDLFVGQCEKFLKRFKGNEL